VGGADGEEVLRTLQTSQIYGQLAVIASGVSPGDRVVVDGQIRVVPGNKVNATRTAPLPKAAPQTPNQSNSSSGIPQ
jgi:multidrug efflux pump subunit AcrA (membrane-fusion protein)